MKDPNKHFWIAVIQSVFLVVVWLLFVFQSAGAQVRPSAEEILKENLTAAFTILRTQDLDQEIKNRKIIDIVNPMFDFSLMAKLSLGRKYWPNLSPDQKESFTQLFIKRLRASYLDYFTLYTDEKVLYEPSLVVRNKVRIPTFLVSKDKKISIIYKFYDSGSNWKVYDLEIQGVSLIRSYRAQFHEILKSGTIDDLITKLEA